MLGDFIGFFVWLGISLIIHEFTHAIIADKLGYKTKIRFFKRIGGKKRYGVHTVVSPWPTPMHDFKILVGAFVVGFVFIGLYVISHPSSVVGLTMIGLYLFFTRDDLKQIMFIERGLTK